MSIPSFAKMYKYWKEEWFLGPHHREQQGQKEPMDSPVPFPLPLLLSILLFSCPSLSFPLTPPSLSSPPTPHLFYFLLPHIYC